MHTTFVLVTGSLFADFKLFIVLFIHRFAWLNRINVLVLLINCYTQQIYTALVYSRMIIKECQQLLRENEYNYNVI